MDDERTHLPQPVADFGPERILIVDDEPGVRRYLLRAVEGRGYSAESVDSAAAALERVSSGEFAVVLADVRMPVHDGIWLLRRIRESDLDVAVVMVTGESEVHTAVDCLTQGATNYVIKPANPDVLAHAVRMCLENRRLQIESRTYRLGLEKLVFDRTRQLEEALDDAGRLNLALEGAYRESIYRLASAAECRDEDTGNHIRRMGLFCQVLAESLGVDAQFLSLIRLAGLMHDVGKIGVHDAILLKPGLLTREEREEISTHTLIGARILSESNSPLFRMAEEIALSHHERYDGSGYPQGLKGEEIPLSGRIAAVADVFDALTSHRVYRPAFSVAEAVGMIRDGNGTQFDPQVVKAFEQNLDRILETRSRYADGATDLQPRGSADFRADPPSRPGGGLADRARHPAPGTPRPAP